MSGNEDVLRIVHRFVDSSKSSGSRPNINGAYYHPDGRLCATNGEVLFIVHDGHDKSHPGTIVLKDGHHFVSTFPDVDKILDPYQGHYDHWEWTNLSVGELIFTHRQLKSMCRKEFGAYRTYPTFALVTDRKRLGMSIQIESLGNRVLYLGESEPTSHDNAQFITMMGYSVNYMLRVLSALKELGEKEVTLSVYDGHILPAMKLTTARVTAIIAGIQSNCLKMNPWIPKVQEPKYQKLSEDVLQSMQDLFETGWEHSYDEQTGITFFTKHGYTIEADGYFKIVELKGTVLNERVRNLDEMIERIHAFAYAVDNDLIGVAKEWIDAQTVIERVPWTVRLLKDESSLAMLKKVADAVSSYPKEEEPPMTGWIGFVGFAEEARSELEAMGVVVGTLDPDNDQFLNCQVSEEAFKQLEPAFGAYVWGLQ